MERGEILELRRVCEWRGPTRTLVEAPVARELSLTIFLNDRELTTLACSPTSEKELVIGFLAREGFLRDPADLRDFRYREEQGIAWVQTSDPEAGPAGPQEPVKPVRGQASFSVRQILHLMRLLDEESRTFKLSGGVHSAALADPKGILVRYEDIGRNNALDRLFGYTFLNRTPTADKALLLSSRLSSALLLKAARIGAPLVISKSAPTALAVDQAEELGLTVVGFGRGERLSVYCHGERVRE